MPIGRKCPKSIAHTIQINCAYSLCHIYIYWFTSEHTGWAVSKRPTYQHIIIHKVDLSRPFLLMPWTIDLLIDYYPYSTDTKLSINWNCPGKWCQRPSSNWNCWDSWFWRLLLIGYVRTTDFGDCLLIGIVWTIVAWYFLTTGIVRTY